MSGFGRIWTIRFLLHRNVFLENLQFSIDFVAEFSANIPIFKLLFIKKQSIYHETWSLTFIYGIFLSDHKQHEAITS